MSKKPLLLNTTPPVCNRLSVINFKSLSPSQTSGDGPSGLDMTSKLTLTWPLFVRLVTC